MPTLADFQEETPGQFVPEQDVQPDMVKHDPNTFAALTAQNALKTMYQQGLSPTGDDIKGVYSKALESAEDYHKQLAQQQQQAILEMQKRQAALSTGTLAAEKSTEAAVQQVKEEQLEQWKQTGEIHAPSEQEQGRVNGYVNGYNTADTLQKYHTAMAATTPGAGGWLKSHVLGFAMQPNITSQETKNFDAYLESAIVPLGKGVFGDAASAATKESIQANMRSMLANQDDNPLSAGNKTWMLKDRIMQNLITDRATAVAAHKDPAIWDTAIGRLSGDYNSPETRQFAPGFAAGQPVVQAGTSQQANATIASVNTGANAGITPGAQPTGYVSGAGTAAGGPTGSPGAIPSPTPAPPSAAQVQPAQKDSQQLPTIPYMFPAFGGT